MFSSSDKKVPCVGMSIGVERCFSILYKMAEKKDKKLGNVRSTETQVFVCGVGKDTLLERMRICKELWNAGIKAEFQYKAKQDLKKLFSLIDAEQIPLAVIIGADEIEKGLVNVKDQRVEKSEQTTVPRSDMVSFIKKTLEKQQS